MHSKLIVFGDATAKNEWRNRFLLANERATFGNSRDVIVSDDTRRTLRVLKSEEDVRKLRGNQFDDAVYIYPQLANVPFSVIEAVQAYLVK